MDNNNKTETKEEENNNNENNEQENIETPTIEDGITLKNTIINNDTIIQKYEAVKLTILLSHIHMKIS